MMTLIQQRNRDFMAELNRELKNPTKPYRNINEAIAHVVKSPAPRYYVTFDTAVRTVGRLLAKGKATVNIKRNSMWLEIAERALLEQKKHQSRLPLEQALARVLVAGNASSFFMSTARGLAIYHEEKRLEHLLKVLSHRA